ncbi:MAG: hypothetical protein HKN23_00900, partial [Verrucomicrobiales bacterium]|nr:hypothetical protein [Verrucomicrobiales bacterium]
MKFSPVFLFAAVLCFPAEFLPAQQKKVPPTGNKSDAGTVPTTKGRDTRKKNVQDRKNTTVGQDAAKDPTLAGYAIFEKTAPKPERTDGVETKLPLKLKKGTRIALVGNTLLDRAGEFGWLEAMLHQAHPEHELVIRNFAWSADEVDLQPRPDNFATVSQHLTREKIDVIFAAFGYNESFAGMDAIDSFKVRLT